MSDSLPPHVEHIVHVQKAWCERTALPNVILAESAAAVLSMSTVAPAVAIVDQAIFSNASGRERMVDCVKNQVVNMVKHPIAFVRQPSFQWIMMVYSGTYIIANNSESLYMRFTHKNPEIPKFIATSAANIGLSILKDRAFARMFGAVGKAVRPVPMTSLGLFGMRDSITIGASFTLVPYVSTMIQHATDWQRPQCDFASQFFTPCLAQFFNTPLYLMGLSLYNAPERTFSERNAFVGREYTKTLVARWARIAPAFGIGGVLNKKIRKYLHGDDDKPH